MKVELLEHDGSLVCQLKAHNVTTSGNVDEGCRQVSFETGIAYLNALKVPGRRIRVTDDDVVRFIGPVDRPRVRLNGPQGTISVSGRDKAADYQDAKFLADTVFEDLTASSTARTIASASASSSLGSGADITSGLRFYSKQLLAQIPEYGYVFGEKLVDGQIVEFSYTFVSDVQMLDLTPAMVETGSPMAGDYSVTINDPPVGVSQYRLTLCFDLGASTNVQSITTSTNGTLTLETSPDGSTWSAYAAGTYRYVRVTIITTSLPITFGLTVITGGAFPASNITTDDGDSFRWASTDTNRTLTLQLASAVAMNDLWLRWGLSDTDKTSRYKFMLEGSNGGTTWDNLGTFYGTPSRLWEYPFTQGTYDRLRITLLEAHGPLAVRFAKIENNVTTQDVATVIRTILTGAGETDFDFVTTRVNFTGTARRGESKLDFCRRLAQLIGARLRWTNTGTAKLYYPDDIDIYADMPSFSAVLSMDAEWENVVANQVIALFESPDLTLVSIVSDDDPASPTSTVNIGQKTAEVHFDWADTQTKLDAAAKDELIRSAKRAITASFTVTANPSLELDSLVKLTNAKTGLSGVFVIEGHTRAKNTDSFTDDSTLQVREVA